MRLCSVYFSTLNSATSYDINYRAQKTNIWKLNTELCASFAHPGIQRDSISFCLLQTPALFFRLFKMFYHLWHSEVPCGMITHLELGCSDIQAYFNTDFFQGSNWVRRTRVGLAGVGGEGAMLLKVVIKVPTHTFFLSQICCEG